MMESNERPGRAPASERQARYFSRVNAQVVTDVTRPKAAPAAAGFSRTDVLLICMVLVWGVNYIVIKAAMREIPPLAFNALRFAIAGPTLALLAWARKVPLPSRADLGRLALLGLVGNSIYQFAFIEGVAHTRAGNAALILAAVPVQAAVLSHLRGQERLRARDVFGLVVSSVGIATIILGSGRDVSFGGTMEGDLLVFGSTVCWTLYIVLSKPAADRYGPLAVTAWTMGLGAIPIILGGVPALLALPWRAVSGAAFAGTAASAMGALVIAYVIWFRGVQRLGPARTSIFSNFTPVVVMLTAWPLLGETPTAWQVTGAAGIFAGLWLTRT
jgi:drug/metabolite transporter (DMT)-like permease